MDQAGLEGQGDQALLVVHRVLAVREAREVPLVPVSQVGQVARPGSRSRNRPPSELRLVGHRDLELHRFLVLHQLLKSQ